MPHKYERCQTSIFAYLIFERLQIKIQLANLNGCIYIFLLLVCIDQGCSFDFLHFLNLLTLSSKLLS